MFCQEQLFIFFDHFVQGKAEEGATSLNTLETATIPKVSPHDASLQSSTECLFHSAQYHRILFFITCQVRTLEMLHSFLFLDHGCYSVARHGTAADPIAAKALYEGRDGGSTASQCPLL